MSYTYHGFKGLPTSRKAALVLAGAQASNPAERGKETDPEIAAAGHIDFVMHGSFDLPPAKTGPLSRSTSAPSITLPAAAHAVLTPLVAEIVTDCSADGRYPSDHFGVFVEYTVRA